MKNMKKSWPRISKICDSCSTKKWLPHVLVLAWCVFLGITIWLHAARSQQPPIYDALTYIQKGKTFWDNIGHGVWINPLNIEPTVRPPGTILMSYPIGFSPDFHGFYFRSIFFPVLALIAAVYMVSNKTLRNHDHGSFGVVMVPVYHPTASEQSTEVVSERSQICEE